MKVVAAFVAVLCLVVLEVIIFHLNIFKVKAILIILKVKLNGANLIELMV